VMHVPADPHWRRTARRDGPHPTHSRPVGYDHEWPLPGQKPTSHGFIRHASLDIMYGPAAPQGTRIKLEVGYAAAQSRH
jgi:hypothetical protein